jgi:hypothetical protein
MFAAMVAGDRQTFMELARARDVAGVVSSGVEECDAAARMLR